MTQPTKTEAIKAFLNAYTHPDLAALYNHDLEVQITVSKGKGERVTGEYKGKQWQAYSDGFQTWKPIRIPVNANTKPEYTDSPMQYDLKDHAEGIGMTGWDWKNLLSRWVAFDFDAITGHSEKHTKKLNETELEQIKTAVANIPFVSLRKSTGGRGLHIYVFLKPIHTDNHNEHAAVARAILSQLSGIAGFDFSSKVDICGGNMWVWHSKLAGTGGEGLKLLKVSTELATVPANWKDYTKVVSGHRTKNLPKFIESQADTQHGIEDIFNELTGQRLRQPIDSEHKAIMSWLHENYPSASWWDAEHHMLVTHTALLKECHAALNLRGKFETEAKGSEKGYDHNCFSGDTEVMTEEGPKTFRELAGKKIRLYVKTDRGMEWILSEVKSFGKQTTVPMYFGDGTKVRTTFNHLWIDRKTGYRIQTWQLKEGKTELPIVSLDLPEINWEAYAHGFVFGDGWKKNTRGKVTCEVALFKHDNDLKSLLCKYGNLGSQKYPGHGYVNMVRQLPNSWKELPENPTKSYALGFILGLISADGFVSTNLQIFQSDYEVLKQVHKLAMYCGLRPYPVRPYGNEGFENAKQGYALTISTYNVRSDMFLRQDHKALLHQRKKHSCATVSKIDWEQPQEEEVFCAVVPHWHNFTLANLVITSNCFMFPISRGAFSVRRFSIGVKEHAYWQQDGTGWTSCFFNREPTVDQASNLYEGIEDTDGSYWFASGDRAQQAAHLLGADLALPPWALQLGCRLKLHKSGRLIAVLEKNKDSPHLPGWLVKGNKLSKMFSIKQNPSGSETEVLRLDDQVRHMVSEGLDDCGWALKAEAEWHNEPIAHIKLYLQSIGYNPQQLSSVLGASVSQCWRLVNLPFREEYPGKRQWNRKAAQLRVKPSLNRDSLSYPSWTKILNHCGKNLDNSVKENEWCKSNGVLTGADWLKCWVASMFQEPLEPLPYIFFYGPQNSGKSIFHEALELLVNKGVCRADQALVSGGGFNGELEGKVLCVIEEVDLKKNVSAYNRIKDWVTSKLLPIHRKMEQPYMTPNSTHWIQCANTHLYCPVFPGDTRITMILVESLKPEDLIPKKTLLTQLENEAPDFLAEILSVELPPSGDRLNVPCIATEDKVAAEYANQSMLEVFCVEKCYFAPGHKVKFSEFSDKFHEWLDPNAVAVWSKIRIGRELPPKYVKARLPSTGEWWVGNMSLVQVAEKDFGPKFHRKDGKLYQEVETVKTDGVNVVMDINFIPGGPTPNVIAIVPGVPEETNGSDQRDVRDGGSKSDSPELPPPVS